jgi:hypothetical protein
VTYLRAPDAEVLQEHSTPQPRTPPALRLVGLHLLSRRVPLVVLLIGLCAAAFWFVLRLDLIPAGGPGAQQLPLFVEGAVAALMAVACGSPFGEPERATGRWLPYLRLGAALALFAAGFGALAVAAAGAHLPGGSLELLRNLAGLTGIGLFTAVLLGAPLAWIGPIAYTVLGEVALAGAWRTLWTWPLRRPHDLAAALCAGLLCTVALVVVAVRGASDAGSAAQRP